MKNKLLLYFPLLIINILFYSCSNKDTITDPINNNNTPGIIQRINLIDKLQNDNDQLLTELLKKMSKDKAVDSIVNIIKKDTSVSYCEKNTQGIMIKYKSGIKGGIFLDAEDTSASLGGTAGAPFIIPAVQKSNIIPGNKKTIFINSHYYERQQWADPIMALYNDIFPRVGFTKPEIYLNGKATLDLFTSLSGYGIIHIYSHGWAWPSKWNTTEVYLMTGETIDPVTSQKYEKELYDGNIPLIKNHGTFEHYWLHPDFFASKNNFEKDSTIFYGGFCFSFLGGWPDKILNKSKALAYTGFTWKVLTEWNAKWAKSLFDTLSNKSYSTPMSIDDWFVKTPSMPKQYYDDEDKVTVKIQYTGHSNATMWGELKIDSLSPNHGKAGTAVNIYGKKFGASAANGSVSFCGSQASVQTWTDTKITVTAPANIQTGFVCIKTGQDESNKAQFTIDADVPNFKYLTLLYNINAVNRTTGSGPHNGKDTSYSYTDSITASSWGTIPISMSGSTFSGEATDLYGGYYKITGTYNANTKTVSAVYYYTLKGDGAIKNYSKELQFQLSVNNLPLVQVAGQPAYNFTASGLSTCNYINGLVYNRVEKPIPPKVDITYTYDYISYYCVHRPPYADSYITIQLTENKP